MIAPLRLYLSLALTVAALAGIGYVRHVIGQNALLRAESAELHREVRIARETAEQAALARDVARAEAARHAQAAAEYDAIREALLKGDDDAPIPEWFRAFLDGLLLRPAR